MKAIRLFLLALGFSLVTPLDSGCKGPVAPAVQQGLGCGLKATEDLVVQALPKVVLALLGGNTALALAAVDALIPTYGLAVITCAIDAAEGTFSAPASSPAALPAEATLLVRNAEAWKAEHASVGTGPVVAP